MHAHMRHFEIKNNIRMHAHIHTYLHTPAHAYLLTHDSFTFQFAFSQILSIETREYLSSEGEAKSWKWSRHFLASKNGIGKTWLMKGVVPEPVRGAGRERE